MGNMHKEGDWAVRLNGMEPHPLPHAHVIFRDGFKVSVCIATGETLAGSVSPAARLKPAKIWIAAHADMLIAEYRRLNP